MASMIRSAMRSATRDASGGSMGGSVEQTGQAPALPCRRVAPAAHRRRRARRRVAAAPAVSTHWTHLPVVEADAIWPSQCEQLTGIGYW
jgi:hypothetical protein